MTVRQYPEVALHDLAQLSVTEREQLLSRAED
ncbi:MAG: hypothetical protein ACI9US_003787, partial [Gammaproteobacteria bacterium]